MARGESLLEGGRSCDRGEGFSRAGNLVARGRPLQPPSQRRDRAVGSARGRAEGGFAVAGDAAAADDGQFPGVWGLGVGRPALAREPRQRKQEGEVQGVVVLRCRGASVRTGTRVMASSMGGRR